MTLPQRERDRGNDGGGPQTVTIIIIVTVITIVGVVWFVPPGDQSDDDEILLPEVPVAIEDVEVNQFTYAAAWWCLAEVFGEDVDAICQAAIDGGCTIVDLVPPEHRETVLAHGLQLGTDLPPPLESDQELPPFGESLAHADQSRRAEILDHLKNHIRSLGEFNAGHDAEQQIRSMIVFAGLVQFCGYTGENPSEDQIQEALENLPKEQVQEALAEGLSELCVVADEHSIDLLLEPLNGAFDGDDWRSHPGYMLPSAHDCATVVRASRGLAEENGVENPRLWLLPDFYHIGYESASCVEIVRQHWEIIGRIHIAGVYDHPPNGPIPTRSEPIYDGQRTDIAEGLALLLELRANDGLKGKYTVVHEWIPFETSMEGVVSSMDRTMAMCEGREYEPLPVPTLHSVQ